MATAKDVTGAAEDAGRAVQTSSAYRAVVSVGLVSYGVVHLLIGWLAVQVAFGETSEQADQTGALQELSSQPFGGIMLWIIAVGLFALTVWQLLEAVLGFRSEEGFSRIRHKGTAALKSVIYGALGVSAARIAAGSGGGSSDGDEESATGTLLSAPAGQILVAAVGAVVIGVGAYGIYRGVSKKFVERDLSGVRDGAGVRLGQIGYVTKGAVFMVMGGLVMAAAITHDPNKSGGLDDALKTLRDQPYGVILLCAVAAGLACFGGYCFFWARHPRHS